jgi:hypothetical protein
MEYAITWRDCRLRLLALDITEVMVGNGANRFRAVHFHCIRSSGTWRISPAGRCSERSPVLSRFHPPPINSVRSIASELRIPSRRVVGVQLQILF